MYVFRAAQGGQAYHLSKPVNSEWCLAKQTNYIIAFSFVTFYTYTFSFHNNDTKKSPPSHWGEGGAIIRFLGYVI